MIKEGKKRPQEGRLQLCLHVYFFISSINPLTHQGLTEFFSLIFMKRFINYSLGLIEFKSVGIF